MIDAVYGNVIIINLTLFIVLLLLSLYFFFIEFKKFFSFKILTAIYSKRKKQTFIRL